MDQIVGLFFNLVGMVSAFMLGSFIIASIHAAVTRQDPIKLWFSFLRLIVGRKG